MNRKGSIESSYLLAIMGENELAKLRKKNMKGLQSSKRQKRNAFICLHMSMFGNLKTKSKMIGE